MVLFLFHFLFSLSHTLFLREGAWDSDLLAKCLDPQAAIVEAYMTHIAGLRWQSAAGSNPGLVYTAMHGVGFEPVTRAFEVAGLPALIPVAAQVQPDPDFPTVEYPNPEEVGPRSN